MASWRGEMLRAAPGLITGDKGRGGAGIDITGLSDIHLCRGESETETAIGLPTWAFKGNGRGAGLGGRRGLVVQAEGSCGHSARGRCLAGVESELIDPPPFPGQQKAKKVQK
eukprot:Hpha_TRINITY_DN6640_c0_g1::TRINITY_DN6640_c0_g1_i1::g.26471::m.26471